MMFTILYVAANQIFKVSPFKSEQEAMDWLDKNRVKRSNPEGELDLDNQHVYMLHPDHRMVELSSSDFDK
jgi:hypothetical protein